MSSFAPEKEKTFSDLTTFFDNVKNLPKDVVPISIAGWPPENWDGPQYRKLAPKRWFFEEWRKTQDNDFYVEHFKREVLDVLDADQVWEDLRRLSKGAPFALTCHEEPRKFCHRHLVSEWLRRHGFSIKEFTR